MADNEFIVPCVCDESPFIAIDDISLNCPADGIYSEIQYLLLADSTQSPAVVPTDWTLALDWAAVIDNATVDGTKIKQLVGIGNVASGEPTARLMPGRRTVYGETTYTLTFTLKSITATIYTFLQKLENCPSLPIFWFVTTGGYMFGAPTGIVASTKRFPFTLAEGEDSYEEYQIILEWKAQTRPLRIVSPV